MLPRKRQRHNPAGSGASGSSVAADTATSQVASASVRPDQMPPTTEPQPFITSEPTPTQPKQLHKARSWYGSWPRPPKATALTSVAKDNIFGGSVKSAKTHDLNKYEARRTSDTNIIVSANTPNPLPHVSEDPEMAPPNDELRKSIDRGNDVSVSHDQRHDLSTLAKDDGAIERPSTPQRPATSSGWAGWWSRTPFTESLATPQSAVTEVVQQPQSDVDIHCPKTPPGPSSASDMNPGDSKLKPPPTTSWFGFWTTPTAASRAAKSTSDVEVASEATKSQQGEAESKDDAAVLQKPEPTPKAGSTWAFWSTDSPKSNGLTPETNRGEIAVIGDQSEAHPKPMDEDTMAGTPSKETKAGSKPKEIATGALSTWRRSKRMRPPSLDIETGSPSSGTSTFPADSRSGSGSLTPTQTEMPAAKVDSSSLSIAESETSTKTPANLLLPSFSNTYQMKENPSILKQVAQFLLRTQQAPASHVCRLKEPRQIRKALSIGVHGLFPSSYLRPMIGHPTGTSLRFATLGAEAIRRWADQHACGDCDIEKVALEGEGKIGDRVDNLWKLMLNWIEHIRKADLIIISCHSQGVPVSIMLVEKLIDLGIITDAKVGVCAMAGVAMGPFPSNRSSFFTGSASELWEFGDPASTISKRLESAMRRVLDYGARITFIGSIDDQLVPMESAVYSPAHHPYIYRAVFIDGRIHAPDFIAHLVGFALKLRNLGISDHGLIRELSIPLAGPLVSGEGHSRLYFDPAVYDLAVMHALETTSTPKPIQVEIQPRGALGGANPYVLPWIMRGMLEEDLVKTELSAETNELLRQFDDWKPTNKALKEVKYRLEAVRSRL